MGSASTRVLITTPISGNMKHHCTLHLSILILLGLIILSATASPSRVNDVSTNEAKAEESRHQIVQRSADPKRRKPKKTRRKLTQEDKRSKKMPWQEKLFRL